MRTVYQLRVEKKEARQIVGQIMKEVARQDWAAEQEEREALANGWQVPGFIPGFTSPHTFRDDDYYCGVAVSQQDDCLVVSGCTSGGTIQEIEIDPASGWITITHDGARSSSLGRVSWYMPERLIALMGSRTSWELVEYETSRSDWAPVCCFLPPEDEEKPHNEEEARAMAWDLI